MIEIKCTQEDKEALLLFMASGDLCLFDFIDNDLSITQCEDCKTCIERMIKWKVRGEEDDE